MAMHNQCTLYTVVHALHSKQTDFSPRCQNTISQPQPGTSEGSEGQDSCVYPCGIILEIGMPKYFLHILDIKLYQ